jgi:hypothetical protein
MVSMTQARSVFAKIMVCCYCCSRAVTAGSLVEEKHHLEARHKRLRDHTSFCAEFLRTLAVR